MRTESQTTKADALVLEQGDGSDSTHATTDGSMNQNDGAQGQGRGRGRSRGIRRGVGRGRGGSNPQDAVPPNNSTENGSTQSHSDYNTQVTITGNASQNNGMQGQGRGRGRGRGAKARGRGKVGNAASNIASTRGRGRGRRRGIERGTRCDGVSPTVANAWTGDGGNLSSVSQTSDPDDQPRKRARKKR
ncbi:hypothetical protein BJV82DRAFT_579241 [Fennellomyces sp. T-0311]|nr:hypothetical protein BJV82DRAFT_579241 [Fennellomyces sp. T-0311]